MNKSAVLKSLPKLSSHDRLEIVTFLCEFDEKDFFSASLPTAEEKQLLDREFEEYKKSRDDGIAWSEVRACLLKK